MKCKTSLSDLYQLYATGELSKKDFEGSIFRFLLDNFERYRIFDDNRDRWDDFLSWLYPRLVTAIDRYQDLGSSFDAYITSLIHGGSREYQYRESEHYITEYVCWQAKAEEMMLHEEEPDYCTTGKKHSIPNFVKPKQILLLLLKSYYFATEPMINLVAQTIGLESCEIQKMIDELHIKRSGRDDEFLALRERLHCQYYRCLAYQKRVCSSQPESEYNKKMIMRYERARKRFYTMKKRLGGIRMSASNKMISEVTGIPQGTIDSCLFSIKHRYALFQLGHKFEGNDVEDHRSPNKAKRYKITKRKRLAENKNSC